MTDLFQLLDIIGKDPFAQNRFSRDPQAFLADAGLDAEVAASLLEGNADTTALAELLQCGPYERCAGCADPGPDPLPGIK